MPRPSKRRTALYCTVISTGQLVIARMPETFVAWAVIRREIHASLKQEHGILAKNVHAIEGFAGCLDGDADGGEALRLCERAFRGAPDVLAAFALHAWDQEAGSFRCVPAGRVLPEG